MHALSSSNAESNSATGSRTLGWRKGLSPVFKPRWEMSVRREDSSALSCQHMLAILAFLSHENSLLYFPQPQKRSLESLLDVSRPATYRPAASTGDHPDSMELAVDFQKQRKIDAICEHLLETVRDIQERKATDGDKSHTPANGAL